MDGDGNLITKEEFLVLERQSRSKGTRRVGICRRKLNNSDIFAATVVVGVGCEFEGWVVE